MKRFAIVTIAGLTLLMTNAQAAEREVLLNVEGMTCVSCPYQVESALKALEGVRKASASFEGHQARVIFDDEKISIRDMIKTLENIGYPASIASGGNG